MLIISHILNKIYWYFYIRRLKKATNPLWKADPNYKHDIEKEKEAIKKKWPELYIMYNDFILFDKKPVTYYGKTSKE